MTAHPEPPDEQVITDPEVARLLSRRQAALHVSSFLDQDRSIAESAARLERPIGQVHHWVHRLVAAGVLRVVEVVPRAGRPIKRYRAVARSFRLPAALVPPEHYEQQMALINREVVDAVASVADMPNQDLTIALGENGQVSISRMTDRRKASLLRSLATTTGGLFLTEEQADELWSELDALTQRWAEAGHDRGTPGTVPYLVQLTMVPRPER